ncbi:MAG TPA: WG repeat-containing protein, partial [Bacteroidia bacterium]|nr:WG repeat-containing protein [Bacteroidia bacterium]
MESGAGLKCIRIIILLFVSITFCNAQTTDRSLFLIQQNDKFGFINSTGKVIIPPQFLNAENFSEGLAAVRVKGTYGYIDASGHFTIPAIYDYAQPFSEGVALVHQNDHSFFINQKGEKLFEASYPLVNSFEHGLAYVQTQSGKIGFINKQGNLVIDTAYVFVRSFNEGFAVARKKVVSNDVLSIDNYGVIDNTGKVIIPFGKYSCINDFKNGSFYVNIIPQGPTTYGSSKVGFIDKNDKLSFSIENSGEHIIDGDMHDGLAIVTFRSQPFHGFINLKGEVLLKNSNYAYVENFNNNRSFVQEPDRSFSMINTKGELIAKNMCTQLLKIKYKEEEVIFKNGKAFIETQDGWGLIDTNAHFVVKPQFYKIHPIGIADGVFFYQKLSDNEMDFESDEDIYGVAKEDGSIITKPFIQDIDQSGFHGGLLKCVVAGKLTYINKKGNIIWQEKVPNELSLRKLNIDFMNRAYFYANTESSGNENNRVTKTASIAQAIAKTDGFPAQQFSLIVFPEKQAT